MKFILNTQALINILKGSLLYKLSIEKNIDTSKQLCSYKVKI